MEKEYVTYNGIRMAPQWAKKIREAQKQVGYILGEKSYTRVRYGEELQDWGAEQQSCSDCGVRKGQFHVLGCDVERCAACDHQLLTCDCYYYAAIVLKPPRSKKKQ